MYCFEDQQFTMQLKTVIYTRQVPLYLRNGALFQSLDADDEELFEVPSHCLKPDRSIRSADDLTHLLHSVRFWGVFDLSADSVDFIRMNMYKQHLDALLEEFPEYKAFLFTSEPHEVICNAIRRGAKREEIVFLHEKMGYQLYSSCWDAVFQENNVPGMRYLLERFTPREEKSDT